MTRRRAKGVFRAEAVPKRAWHGRGQEPEGRLHALVSRGSRTIGTTLWDHPLRWRIGQPPGTSGGRTRVYGSLPSPTLGPAWLRVRPRCKVGPITLARGSKNRRMPWRTCVTSTTQGHGRRPRAGHAGLWFRAVESRACHADPERTRAGARVYFPKASGWPATPGPRARRRAVRRGGAGLPCPGLQLLLQPALRPWPTARAPSSSPPCAWRRAPRWALGPHAPTPGPRALPGAKRSCGLRMACPSGRSQAAQRCYGTPSARSLARLELPAEAPTGQGHLAR